jgi:quinol monooxygenase YgiN
MYGVIVTMTVRDGERDAFEDLVKGLAAAVKAQEPGNLSYHILRSRTEPSNYRIVEIYASKEAFKLHLGADYVRNANSQVLKTLTGTPEAEVLEVVA